MRDGAALWAVRTLEDAELARVVALTGDGLTVRDIAGELGVSAGKVSKLQGRARDAGEIADAPRRGGRGGRRFDGGAGGG